MSEKPYCYQREAFLLAATRRVAISNSTFYYQRNDVSLIDFQENRKRSHIPPLRAEIPLYIGVPDSKGGMWNLLHISRFLIAFLLISCCLLAYRLKVMRLSLAPLALTSRGSRAYFSHPTRILLVSFRPLCVSVHQDISVLSAGP